MTRISNSLFESIRQVTHPVIAEAKAEDAGKVDGAHFCATHVEHSLYGEGECISEQHAKPNADGTIDWYNVKFADGNVRKIQTEAVKVKKAKMHEHATPEGDTIEEKKLDPVGKEDADIDNNGKVDKSDSYLKNRRKAISANIKEEEAIEGFDPLKHVAKDKQTPALKSAARRVDRGDYGARARILKAGGVKDDRGPRGVTQEEAEKIDELSIGTLTKVKHAAVRDANDATRDGDDAKADKRYNLAGKASNKAEMKYRAAGLKPSGQHTMEEVEEGVTETIVKHNDFTIEITDNPTFGDFLRAVQSIVRTDEESMQKQIVAVAEQAFAENYEEVIIEAFTRMELEDKIAAHRKAGNTVSNDKYSTKNGQPYAEYVVTDQEGGRKKYIHHGTRRSMESMSSVTVKK